MADLFPYRGTFEPPMLPSFILARQSYSLVPHALSISLVPIDVIVDVLANHYVHWQSYSLVPHALSLVNGKIILILIMLGLLMGVPWT